MNKILSGIIGIVLTVGLVTGSAFALFTAQATVSGIELNTSSSSLWVGVDGNAPAGSSVDLTGVEDTLSPGESSGPELFTLRNNSSEVNFMLTAQLTAAGGDWGILNTLIEAAIIPVGDSLDESDWKTLATWNASDVSIDDTVLNAESNRDFNVYYRLSETADNSVSGKTLSNITFVFTGTQVDPTP